MSKPTDLTAIQIAAVTQHVAELSEFHPLKERLTRACEAASKTGNSDHYESCRTLRTYLRAHPNLATA